MTSNTIEPYKSDHWKARYDDSDSIVYIVYRGRLNAVIAAEAFGWIGEALKQVLALGITLHGAIEFPEYPTACCGGEWATLSSFFTKSELEGQNPVKPRSLLRG